MATHLIDSECARHQKPKRKARAFEMSKSASSFTIPSFAINRCSEIDLMSSHFAYEVSLSSDVWGSSSMCEGRPRCRVVHGMTITTPARLWLSRSAEMMTAGRRPACSEPIGTPKSTSQMSPRFAVTLRSHEVRWLQDFVQR